jgi:hypothetical protein
MAHEPAADAAYVAQMLRANASPCETCEGAGTVLCADCEPVGDEVFAIMTTYTQERKRERTPQDAEFAEARDMMRRLRKQHECTNETRRDRDRKRTNIRHMRASVAEMRRV